MKLNKVGGTVIYNASDLEELLFDTTFDERILYDIGREMNIKCERLSVKNFYTYFVKRGENKTQESIEECMYLTESWYKFYEKFCDTYSFPCVIYTKCDPWLCGGGSTSYTTKVLSVPEYVAIEESGIKDSILKLEESLENLHQKFADWL